MTSPSLDDILRARERIAHAIYLSPLIRSASLSRLAGAELHLKLENRQITGSFKERGALNRMLELSSQERGRGVIAASAGNHAQAVAYHARRLEIAATIVMPEPAPLTKVVNTRSHGAEVILVGQSYADAYTRASQLMKQGGATLLHAYDDPLVVAGQGTIGLELIEQEPELDAVVVPVGGGGLISGSSLALRRALGASLRILGAEPAGAPSMSLGLEAGKPVDLDEITTEVQGLCPPNCGGINIEICRETLDGVHLLPDAAIFAAQEKLVKAGHVVEPAGAAAAALVFSGGLPAEWLQGRGPDNPLRVAAVISGGNPDPEQLARVRAQ